MNYASTEKITPARAAMPFADLVKDVAHRIEGASRRAANMGGPRVHLWAWRSYVTPSGELMPGQLYITLEEEPTPPDPYAAKREELPIYVRPINATRWNDLPYDHIKTRLHDAMRSCPVLGDGDT